MAHWHLGQYALALTDLRTNTDKPDPDSACVYCRALVLFSLQNYAGAVEAFTNAVTLLRASIADTQRLRSVMSNYRKLEPDEFDDAHDKAMLAKSLFQRSRVLQQMGDPAAANVDLAEARALDPEYANPEVI
jgi:tetratricopeptide (TPR) repeat protein